MMQIITKVAGIDTSKQKLDVAVHGDCRVSQVENSKSGWEELSREVRQAGIVRIGIEASGGYERGVVRHLRACGFTVVVLQPIQVKAFAKMHLRAPRTMPSMRC